MAPQRAKRETRSEKVTVTLRPTRVAYADSKARELGISRSEVIDEIIGDAEERENETAMIAGYKALRGENLALAEEGMESLWEVIDKDLPWSDAPERLSDRSLGLRCPSLH